MYKSLTKVILVRDQTNKSIGKNLKNTFYILDIVKYFPSDQLQAFCICLLYTSDAADEPCGV